MSRAGRCSAAAVLVLMAACTGPPPGPLPTVESWGDAERPYDDAIENAAWLALGPGTPDTATRGLPPMRLREFWELDAHSRAPRQTAALLMLDQYVLSHRDSLPFALEAARVDPSSAPAYFESARLLLARGGTERAHALAAQGVRLDPADAGLWGVLAETYVRRGDDARARTALEHALALDPKKVVRGYESLAILYLRAGEVARADSVLARGGTSNPTLALYIEGVQARGRGDLEEARAALAQAASDPNAQPAILIDWGNVEYELGNLDVAATAYERALRLAPREHAALNGLGTVLRARGRLEEAMNAFQQLVATRPQDTGAQFNLAGTSLDAAQRAGKGAHADSLYRISEQAFSACIDAKFRARESLERRAHIRLHLGNTTGATADARTLLADPAGTKAAHLLLARAALAQGDLEGVVRALAPQFATDSLSTDGLDLLGNTYLKLDRPRAAVPVLERAHAREPEDYRTTMNYGVALSRSGSLAAAEAVFRALAAERPHDADVLQNLAAVLQRRGRRAEAEQVLQQAAPRRAP